MNRATEEQERVTEMFGGDTTRWVRLQKGRTQWHTRIAAHIPNVARFSGHAGGCTTTSHAAYRRSINDGVYGEAATPDMVEAHGKIVRLAMNGRENVLNHLSDPTHR
jgi:hypothetical protein